MQNNKDELLPIQLRKALAEIKTNDTVTEYGLENTLAKPGKIVAEANIHDAVIEKGLENVLTKPGKILFEANIYNVATEQGMANALNSAANGDTIRLIAPICHCTCDICITKNITIDLNGYGLTSVGAASTALEIHNAATLTVKGPGILTVNATDKQYGILNENGVIALTGGARLIAVGGDFGVYTDLGGKTAVTTACGLSGVFAGAKSEITVAGNVGVAETSGAAAVAVEGGKITIDGTVTVPAGAIYIKVGEKHKTQDQHELTSSKAGYLEYTDGVSFVWVKKPGAATATHKAATETELRAAINSASNGDTIRLTADIYCGDPCPLYITNSITIDLNGHNLTRVCDVYTTLQIHYASTLTVNGPGIFTADCANDGHYGMYNHNSTITISGGAILNAFGGCGVSTIWGARTTVTIAIGRQIGVFASKSSEITVAGNVWATGNVANGGGAIATSGGKITIEGMIMVPAGATYIRVGETCKNQDQYEPISSKPGYLEYTDGENYVWVKGAAIITSPIITTQPIDAGIAPGIITEFSVKASGYPALTYQWQGSTDGKLWTNFENMKGTISGATEAILTLMNMLPSLVGHKVRCLVSNMVGRAISKTATLIAPSAPMITMHPLSAATTPGGSAAFTIEAISDTGALCYSWYYTTVDDPTKNLISDNYIFYGSETAMLRLNNVPKSFNGYRFICQVKNSYKDVFSEWAYLGVVPAEPQTYDVADETALATTINRASYGDTIRLMSNIHSSNYLLYISKSITIDLNGYNLTASGGMHTVLQINNAWTLTIKGPGVFTADGAGKNYGLYNDNSTIAITGGAIINAIGGDFGVSTIWGGKTTVSAVSGLNGVFASTTNSEITVTGNVEATDNAAFGGAVATSGGKIIIEGMLTVPDGATYIRVGEICKNQDQHEAISSKPGYLEYTDGESYVWVKGAAVLVAPTVTAHPEDADAVAGGIVNFSVEATGNPAPTYQWQSSADGKLWVNLRNMLALKPASGFSGLVLTDQWQGFAEVAPINKLQGSADGISLIGVQNIAATKPVSGFSGATTATLTLSNVQAASNGTQYRCLINNLMGSVTSKIAKLTVSDTNAYELHLADDSPTILHLADCTVTEGWDAVFFATVLSWDRYVYWEVQTEEGVFPVSGVNPITTDKAILVLYNVTLSMNGYRYRCVVSNEQGIGSSVSNFATLTVVAASTQPTPTLALNKSSYAPNEEIIVTPKGHDSSDYILLAVQGDSYNNCLTWIITSNFTSVRFTAPANSGTYELRLHSSNVTSASAANLKAKASFTVIKADAATQPPPTLSLNKSSYAPGEEIVVTPKGHDVSDYILLSAQGDPYNRCLTWILICNFTTLRFAAPAKAGTYELRLHPCFTDSASAANLKAKATFIVT